MNICVKLITEDTESAFAVKNAIEKYPYNFQQEEGTDFSDLRNGVFIVIADRSSIRYQQAINELKHNVSSSLIILAEKGDPGITDDIMLLKPSGVIFKIPDADYVCAAVENAVSGFTLTSDNFSWDSIIRAMMDSPAMILLADRERNIRYANRAFFRLTGFHYSELSCSCRSLGILREMLESVFNTSVNWKGEITDLTKDGREFTILSSISVVKNLSGGVIGYVCISEDISARKEIESNLEQARMVAEETSAAKTRFLATISHEIRTPMNAIIGMTDLALLTDDNDEKLDYLIELKGATRKLLRLTDDLLDFSKLESGKIKLDLKMLRLARVVKDAVERFAHSADDKKLNLTFSVSSDVSQRLTGDPFRIGQILDHLIGNSIKFTEKGNVEVNVVLSGETFIHREKYQLVKFSVSDTGIGISPEKQSVIFEKFRQCEETTARSWGGTGIGLAISQSLVRMMGGAIIVESSLDKGSNFSFTVPLKIELQETEENGRNLETITVSKRLMKILLVEDNPVNARITEIILKKLGHTVDIAGNGLISIDKLRESAYDVIFMDIEMPVMDGIEATRRIRNGEAGSRMQNIPVVAMTAHAVSEYEEECRKTGMNWFLTKPINVMLIPELLNAIINKPAVL